MRRHATRDPHLQLVRPPPQSHLVKFYAGHEELAKEVGRYLVGGIDRKEAIVAITTADHLAGLRDVLAAAGMDPTALAASGQVTFLDAERTLNRILVDGRPDPVRFEIAVGAAYRRVEETGRYPHVRMYGEMVDLLAQRGALSAAIELEGLWNNFQKNHRFTLLCTYRMSLLDQGPDIRVFDQICSTHTHTITAEDSAKLQQAVNWGLAKVLGTARADALRPLIESTVRGTGHGSAERTLSWVQRNLPSRTESVMAEARAYLASEPSSADRPGAGPTPAACMSRPMNVLLAEDDPDDIFFVEHAFACAAPEAHLTVVGDGEALQDHLSNTGPSGDSAHHRIPDLVLLDIKMPKMDGLEVLEWMKRVPHLEGVPVVMLSSSMEPRDLDRAYRLGASAYLSKEDDLNSLDRLVAGFAALVATKQEEPIIRLTHKTRRHAPAAPLVPQAPPETE